MMEKNLYYHNLGKFVVLFQNVEKALSDLIVLLAKADDEVTRILINELEYSSLVKTIDVLFARYVDVCKIDPQEKKQFHSLLTEFSKLGELRNNLMHSKYADLLKDGEVIAIVRTNSKLRGKKGIREAEEEDLNESSFESYFDQLESALNKLQRFRHKIIGWKYPINDNP